MISKSLIRLSGAKISNPLAWCVVVLMLLCNGVRAQGPKAAYDSARKEIILFFNGDSTAVISFDKTFEAGFNHEKKRKKKTVRYRLARYGKPDSIETIPVYLANRNTRVHLRGQLHGDTTVPFTLEIRATENMLLMDITVKDISINEAAFTLRMLKPLPLLGVNVSGTETSVRISNCGKGKKRIQIFGNVTVYGIQIMPSVQGKI